MTTRLRGGRCMISSTEEVAAMPVPGTTDGAAPEYARRELFSVDAYRRTFEAGVVAVDAAERRVALAQTAFYPGGGGQPHDLGVLRWAGGELPVTRVGRVDGQIWHWLEADELPPVGADVHGELDWSR